MNRQGALQMGSCLLVPRGTILEPSQDAEAGRDVPLGLRPQRLAQGQRSPDELLGPVVRAQLRERRGELVQHGGPHLGLAGQLLVDAAGAVVEQVSHRGDSPRHQLRAAALEKAPEELGNLGRLLGLVARAIALQPRGPCLVHGRTEADHEAQHGRRRRSGGRPVPAQELGGPIEAAGRPRANREALQVPADVLAQLRRGGVTLGRLRAQRLEHDVVEVAAQGTAQRARRHRGGRSHVLPVGTVPAEQLVEDHAQRIDVAGRRHPAPALLLRARVVRGQQAQDRGRLVQALRDVWAQQLGDPEVEQLRIAVGRDQDVRRLEVAMDDQVLVRVLHRVAHPPNSRSRAATSSLRASH